MHERYVLEHEAADRVIKALDRLSTATRPEVCTDEGGFTLHLVVRSDLGEVPVVAQAYGCEPIRGWGADRVEAKALLALVREQVEQIE